MSKSLEASEVSLLDVTLPTPEVLGADSLEASPTNTRLWSPAVLLQAGTTYTLVASTQHVEFATLSNEPVLQRVWPSAADTAQVAVFCVEQDERLSVPASINGLWAKEWVLFEPAGDAGMAFVVTSEADGGASGLMTEGAVGSLNSDWHALAGALPCWLWKPAQGVAAVSPARVGSFAVEPTRSGWGSDRASATATACSTSETHIGDGCVEALDDRMHIRTGDRESLWFAQGQQVEGWFAAVPGETGVIGNLKPNQSYSFGWTVFYADLKSSSGELSLRTRADAPHIVINEVLADPLGAEPDQEWVEVYNDGTRVVNLQGWSLNDEGGRVELPDYDIAPSGYLLLVNDTYTRDGQLDIVPEAHVPLLRLPSLGKSGLSNAGETLRLLDGSGIVVSSFPGTPKPTAGVSVARRATWLVSTDLNAFQLHGGSGASPGAANLTIADLPK